MIRRLVLTSNEPRSKYLFAEIKKRTEAVEVDFDDIDLLTRCVAATLSFRYPRVEWYRNYQMHPLIQRRRRKVLLRNLRLGVERPDALLMWGSWFHPFTHHAGLPYFNYIDQSRSALPILGEPKTSSWGRRRSHDLQAHTYRDARGVFCMSEWAREQTLLAHSVPDTKVHVVKWGPCAVDLSEEDHTDYKREELILHVSNDFHRKGVDYLLATAARVKNVVPAARFIVVGGDTSRMRIQNTDNVVFTGPIRDRDVLADLFRRATAFFLPHRFDRSPHVLVEAMSAALPLIVSKQGGPTELINRQGTGYCVPVGDIDGYTRAVLSLLQDPVGAREMGSRAKALMLSGYTWPKVADAMLRLMENLLTFPR